MVHRMRVVAPIRAVLKPKKQAIRSILAVRSGLFKQILEACKNFGCKVNSYYHHVKGSAFTMPLNYFNLAAIKESVKAATPAAANAAAAPTAFNYLLCIQEPISTVAALRAINPCLKPGTGYTKKGFGFEDYSTVMEWAGKEATDSPLGYQGVALAVKVRCGLQLHPNTVGEAKRQILAVRAQARKGASSTGAGTAAAAAAKTATPQQRGDTAQYLHEGVVKLNVWVHEICTQNMPVFKCTLMGASNAHIKGTKWEENCLDGVTEN